MGTIVEKVTNKGTKYKALVRVKREGFPPFSQSKTFSQKSLATAWIKKLEAQIEVDNSILDGSKVDLTLAGAIDRYLQEVGDNYSRSKIANLLALKKSSLSHKKLDKLSRVDFSTFAAQRLEVVKPQTLGVDFIDLRSVLKRANYLWGAKVNLSAFEEVVASLRYSRQITPSAKRTRLPTSDELKRLTNYFRDIFNQGLCAMPMHLIIWFAIYTGRRQNELTKMFMADYDEKAGTWFISDTKSAKGKGNHLKVKMSDNAVKMIPIIQDAVVQYGQMGRLKHYDTERLLPFQSKSFSARFTDACASLGIEDLHFHDLRHEASTRFAEQGLSIPQIQQYTGHKSWSSLQIYVNMTPREDVIDYWDIL